MDGVFTINRIAKPDSLPLILIVLTILVVLLVLVILLILVILLVLVVLLVLAVLLVLVVLVVEAHYNTLLFFKDFMDSFSHAG